MSDEPENIELQADIETPSDGELQKLEERIKENWEYYAFRDPEPDYDNRPVSLNFDTASLQYHLVTSVQVHVETQPVRFRVEQKQEEKDSPF